MLSTSRVCYTEYMRWMHCSSKATWQCLEFNLSFLSFLHAFLLRRPKWQSLLIAMAPIVPWIGVIVCCPTGDAPRSPTLLLPQHGSFDEHIWLLTFNWSKKHLCTKHSKATFYLHKEDMINRPDLYRKDRRTCLSIQIEPERKSQKHHSHEIKAF
jgi:hypothetical protein